MPWYKSGTVSVAQNSNAVIGSGTAFIANSRVGDAFRGPDGGWYEITNIASDTAISISPNYQGATNGAGGYALAPLQGYVKESADRLRALILQYGDKLAALGTTGNYDILPIAKGGTGANSADNAVSNLGFMAGNMYPKFGGIGVATAAGGYNLQGGYMGWATPGSAVTGAMDFICNRGGGTGGFTWKSVNGNNTASGPTMSYTYDGTLTVPSSVSVPRIDNLTSVTSPFTAAPTVSNGAAFGASITVRGAPFVNSWARLDWANTQLPAASVYMTYLDNTGLAVHRNDAGGGIEFWTQQTRRLFLGGGGVLQPGTDNNYPLGSGSLRFLTAYLNTAPVVTSDAREKTKVRKMTVFEIAAAKALGKEIGFYNFIKAVEEKGDGARLHCSMTVQRAMEVMREHGLEPTAYSFICYDSWEEEVKEHPAEYEQLEVNDPGNGLRSYEQGALTREAWTEVLVEKGDRYSFRTDGLLFFIAAGLEARMAALEELL